MPLEHDEPTTEKKRRGLTLPPRGRAATRLQDLEAPPEASSIAVNTASSNAVNTALLTASSNAVTQPPARLAPRAGGAPMPAAKEPTTRITVDMPDSLHKQLSYLSVETRRSIKDLVIEALNACYFEAARKDVP